MRAVRLIGWLVLGASLLVAAGALLPVSPIFLTDQLDVEFGATLHVGFATGQTVAPRQISTFGPLGFLFYPIYYPPTFAALFALRVALAAATCWTLAWIGYAAWASPWGGALAVLGCVPFLALPDVWFLTVPLLAALLELTPRPAPLALRLVLGAVIGLVSMIKFTILVASALILAPLTVAALLARRVPVLAIAAAATAGLTWIATGHGWTDWFAYLDWSAREISAGYPSAMQLPLNRNLLEHTAAVSGAVLLAAILLAGRRQGWRAWAVASALLSALYLLVKQGFVRADVHVFIPCYGLLVIAILLGVLWGPRPVRVLIAAALVVGLPGRLWMDALAVNGPPTLHFDPVLPPEAVRRLLAAPTALRGETLAKRHAGQIGDLRGNLQFPTEGTIDVYSYDQAFALASTAEFRPRPVFQSYMAYTARLAHANADSLLSDRAPEWILFRVAPIDNGLPALDDAPSWPLLLSRYRFTEQIGTLSLLKRRSTPLAWQLEPIGRSTTETGQSVLVPPTADGPIWARIDVHETRRDALWRAVLAPPRVFLDVLRRDGQPHRYRVVPAVARDGFLLSPLVDTTPDFVRLATGEYSALAANDVGSLRVHVDELFDLPPEPHLVDVEFFRLVIAPDV